MFGPSPGTDAFAGPASVHPRGPAESGCSLCPCRLSPSWHETVSLKGTDAEPPGVPASLRPSSREWFTAGEGGPWSGRGPGPGSWVCVCAHECVRARVAAGGSGTLAAVTQDGRSPSGPRDAPSGVGPRCSLSCLSRGDPPACPAQPVLPAGNSATCWGSGARTPRGQTAEAGRRGDRGTPRHPVLGFGAVGGRSPGPGGEPASLRPQGPGAPSRLPPGAGTEGMMRTPPHSHAAP